MAIESTNPATGELLASFEPLDAAAIDERLGRAAAAFQVWRRTSFAERASGPEYALPICSRRIRRGWRA